MRRLLLAALLLIGVAHTAWAGGTENVSTLGSDTSSRQNTLTPCRTIGHAVGQLFPGGVMTSSAGLNVPYDVSLPCPMKKMYAGTPSILGGLTRALRYPAIPHEWCISEIAATPGRQAGCRLLG
ncbi:MAG TPA: hypothetical protein VEL28_22555 [Candidatus Binatia bacterium]|nr:hypothetical protein [Candidatus Binatia bacterium]